MKLLSGLRGKMCVVFFAALVFLGSCESPFGTGTNPAAEGNVTISVGSSDPKWLALDTSQFRYEFTFTSSLGGGGGG
jgi:hypothetical protein